MAEDIDEDGILDAVDNCLTTHNQFQTDHDDDDIGDLCDDDDDNDSVTDVSDNCPFVNNTNQNDSDGDSYGDSCDVLVNRIIPTSGILSWVNYLAFNPETNRIYLCNNFSLNILDLETDSVIEQMTLPATCEGISFNPATNRLYVAINLVIFDSRGSLMVLDGTNGEILDQLPLYSGGTADAGLEFLAYPIAINPTNNRIYVGGSGDFQGSGRLHVIDGNINEEVSTIEFPFQSGATFHGLKLAVNHTTNRVYIAGNNETNGLLTIIDGSTDEIIDNIQLPLFLTQGVAVNPVDGRIYVMGTESYPDGLRLIVIDGTNNNIVANIDLSSDISGGLQGIVGINFAANKIYLAVHPFLKVIDGATYSLLNEVRLPEPSYVGGPIVDQEKNLIYTIGSGGIFQVPVLRVFVGAANSTPIGTNVGVEPLDSTTGTAPATLTFANVTQNGDTTLASSTEGTPPPSGFKVGDPAVYYDVSTTATFTGTVTLCFSWVEGQFQNEDAIKLFHYESGNWLDVTTSQDTVQNKVCGQTASLSPFALFETSYVFTGFFSPVDNSPTRNEVKAGSAVPVKFSLNGNHGTNIFEPGYPGSQSVQCNTNEPVDEIEEIVLAGESSLTYDASSDQYKYVWKTNKAWKNTCRQLLLKFNDGSMKTAEFNFK